MASQELSAREEQVLELAGQGLTDHGIAKALGVKHSTVVTYWTRIRSKLGGTGRTHLVGMQCKAKILALVEQISMLGTRAMETIGRRLGSVRSLLRGSNSREIHDELNQIEHEIGSAISQLHEAARQAADEPV